MEIRTRKSLDVKRKLLHALHMTAFPSPSLPSFETALRTHTSAIESFLDTILSQRIKDGEINRPAQLLSAMRYGVLNGGKRLRPFLLCKTAALFDEKVETVMYAAAALECVHCYSLIHDDLPIMDNDELRRGKPTVHKVFDEATALLSGNALLTMAFDFLADPENGLSAKIRLELILLLSRAAGIGGMLGGQMLDLSAHNTRLDEREVVILQSMKTGALLRFACEAGAILGNAPPNNRARLAEFGSILGLIFQLVDDLLDVIGDTDSLGKTIGKDMKVGKATLLSLHGREWLEQKISGLLEQARKLLAPFGKKAELLHQVAFFIARRKT